MSNEELHRMLTELRDKHYQKITFFMTAQCDADPLKTLIEKVHAGINSVSMLPLDHVPMYINEERFEVRECVKWRLENGI